MPTSLTLFTLQQKFHSHTYIQVNWRHKCITYAASLLRSSDSDGGSDYQPPAKRQHQGTASNKGGRTRSYLDIHAPEHEALCEKMDKMRRFFTDPVSLQRGRDPIASITWERVQLHHLRKSVYLPLVTHPSPRTQTMPEAPHYVRRSHIMSVYTLYN